MTYKWKYILRTALLWGFAVAAGFTAWDWIDHRSIGTSRLAVRILCNLIAGLAVGASMWRMKPKLTR